MPLAVPIGWPQPLSYQLFQWLFLGGGPSLGVTRSAYGYSYGYSYGHSYGVALASGLPGIPIAIPTGCPQPPSYQLFLRLFLWGGPSIRATRDSYGYYYGVAPASKLPGIPMAIPMAWLQPPSYQLFLWPFLWLWLFLWGDPRLRVISYAYSYSWGAPPPRLQVSSYSYGYSSGVAPASALPGSPVAIPMGWPSASKLPGIPMAILYGFPMGWASFRVASSSYGYCYGIASASELPAIPVAIPLRWPKLPSHRIFIWGGPSLQVTLIMCVFVGETLEMGTSPTRISIVPLLMVGEHCFTNEARSNSRFNPYMLLACAK